MSSEEYMKDHTFTFQGGTLAGLAPLDSEEPIWVFCGILREAVYSYPAKDTIQEELKYYIDKLYEEWQVCCQILFKLHLFLTFTFH